MNVSRIGWHYGDTVGSIDRDLQSAAGHAVAWAFHCADRDNTSVRIWLRVRADHDAGGVVWFDYPLDGDIGVRTRRAKRELFEESLASRVPMNRHEARAWWEYYVTQFLRSPFPGKTLFEDTERPAPPEPNDFMRRLMEAGHPLNEASENLIDIVDPDLNRVDINQSLGRSDIEILADYIDEYTEHAELEPEPEPEEPLVTPGTIGLSEDLPPPPELPPDHPLNAVADWTFEIRFVQTMRELTFDGFHQHIFQFVTPDRAVARQNVIMDGSVRGTLYDITRFYDADTGTPMYRVRFTVLQEGSRPPELVGLYRVRHEHPTERSGQIVLVPVAAVPANDYYPTCEERDLLSYLYVYDIDSPTCDDTRKIAVYAHTDNGHMVLGLFFVPPGEMPEDWRARALGWARWNWGAERTSLRINAPTDTRMRNNPGTYIPSLLDALLNHRFSFLVDEWGMPRNGMPEVPSWFQAWWRRTAGGVRFRPV